MSATGPEVAADLLALAVRCEAAVGADRELDARVWCALNGKRYRGHNPAYGSEVETQVEFTEPPKRTRLVSGRHTGGHALPVTASLDAAMTLVPEGWHVGNWSEDWRSRVWACRLVQRPSPGQCAAFDAGKTIGLEAENGEAFTPALALCAASLRARAHLKDQAND